MSTGITVYGAYWCPDCRRSKRFLSEHQIGYDWVDIEQDEEARAHVEKLNDGKRIIPTITFADGSFLVEPSNAELAEKLNLTTRDPHEYHDVTIVGAGPAGLTAAIYAARDGFSVMVIDEGALGGQASTTGMLDNFPGFPEGIQGAEWAARVVKQARRYGVEFLQAQTVVGVARPNGVLCVTTGDGSEYGSGAVLLATGADYRRLGIEGEEDFIGAGVHFCATCDGPFYKGKEVAVVGGGNSAAEESLGLLRFATHVTLLVRGPRLKASRLLIDKVTANPQITVRYNTVVTRLAGDGRLETVHVREKDSGREDVLSPDGLFVFIGQQPNSGFLKGSEVLLDDYGYILTGHALKHHSAWHGDYEPEVLETSMPGVFAAGDVRAGSTKQV
ncbi:MAG: FAD-dependent oxidoreductase, partial [Caldilineae bacterium]